MQYNKVLLKLIACGLIILNHVLKLILFFRNKSCNPHIFLSVLYYRESYFKAQLYLGFFSTYPTSHISEPLSQDWLHNKHIYLIK